MQPLARLLGWAPAQPPTRTERLPNARRKGQAGSSKGLAGVLQHGAPTRLFPHSHQANLRPHSVPRPSTTVSAPSTPLYRTRALPSETGTDCEDAPAPRARGPRMAALRRQTDPSTDGETEVQRTRDPRRIDHSSRRILFGDATPRPKAASRISLASVPSASTSLYSTFALGEFGVISAEPGPVPEIAVPVAAVPPDEKQDKGADKRPSWRRLLPPMKRKIKTAPVELSPCPVINTSPLPGDEPGRRGIDMHESPSISPQSGADLLGLQTNSPSDAELSSSSFARHRAKLRRRSASASFAPSTPPARPPVHKSATQPQVTTVGAPHPSGQAQTSSAPPIKSRFQPLRDLEVHLYNAGIGTGPRTDDAWELCTTPIPRGGIPRTRYEQLPGTAMPNVIRMEGVPLTVPLSPMHSPLKPSSTRKPTPAQ